MGHSLAELISKELHTSIDVLQAVASDFSIHSTLEAVAQTTAVALKAGHKLIVAVESAGNISPFRYARRHRNTWFAFTPSACATRATLAPGSSVSSTIRRFSSTDHRLRPIHQASTVKPQSCQRGTSNAYLTCPRKTQPFKTGVLS